MNNYVRAKDFVKNNALIYALNLNYEIFLRD